MVASRPHLLSPTTLPGEAGWCRQKRLLMPGIVSSSALSVSSHRALGGQPEQPPALPGARRGASAHRGRTGVPGSACAHRRSAAGAAREDHGGTPAGGQFHLPHRALAAPLTQGVNLHRERGSLRQTAHDHPRWTSSRDAGTVVHQGKGGLW